MVDNKNVRITLPNGNRLSFPSRSAAAKALVECGVAVKIAAIKTGISYATVFAITKAAEKTAKRAKTYRDDKAYFFKTMNKAFRSI